MKAELLRAAMRAAGLDYGGPMHADGRLHRFKAEGDKALNSWFVLHGGPPAAGAFGCWKRGFKESWCEKRREKCSDGEWKRIREDWQRADEERERGEAGRHAEAREKAGRVLNDAKPVRSHAYLERKSVKVSGELREQGSKLVLPLRDASGGLHSLQFIGADGVKRFLTGGRVTACFFTVCDRSDGPLVICEGFATGASIHEATGFAVVCAMNCGNLKAVAEALRAKWPQREVIIAADNDAFTNDKDGKPSNPGVEAATAAAQAIRARLAIPQFADLTTKPTDFNDLARLAGGDTVRKHVESAAFQCESDEDVLLRLAGLPPLEYERQREGAAKALGCRALALDKLVDAKRLRKHDAGLQGGGLNLADVEPWGEAVDGAAVLNEVAATFTRFVALPEGAADALALWCAHAHAFKAFTCSPRLNISSPEKGCGKTTLRDVVSLFVPRPLPAENLSVAVLFRVIEGHRPTVLADECDAWLLENEELRGLLNAGHRRGGQALRCEGDDNEVRAFNVFAPAVLCGIGSLPGTLHDRSLVIRLERAKPGELRERFDSRRVGHEKELCRKLSRFCADIAERLEGCDPVLPCAAVNRLADNWRPLFAVAELAGGEWPQRAAAAFVKLTNHDDTDAQGIGATLLADIAAVFAAAGVDKLPSEKLTKELADLEGRPWAEWGRQRKQISTNQLANQLRRFGIAPRVIRVGDDTPRGYVLAEFAEAFERYLPMTPPSECNTATAPENMGDVSPSRPQHTEDVLHPENASSPCKDKACCTVAPHSPAVACEPTEALLL